MVVLLKTSLVWVSFIQIMQVRVQNKGKSVWKSRYVGDVSKANVVADALSQKSYANTLVSRVWAPWSSSFARIFLYFF